MDVYDFDNTIYRGDSTADFILYCYLHRPKSLLSLPRTAVCGLLYVLRLMPKLTFKQNLYHMFVYIDDMESFVAQFIDSHTDHIKEWYNRQQKDDDVVISASPEFVIVPFCRKIGIRTAMASRVDMHTGKNDGINCHGEEKVKRFYERFPEGTIDSFYSDSYSDTPLARLAEKAFLVKGDQLLPWGKK
jgi:HAD superfamily phosphoserine phosphatase-like hydrolase